MSCQGWMGITAFIWPTSTVAQELILLRFNVICQLMVAAPLAKILHLRHTGARSVLAVAGSDTAKMYQLNITDMWPTRTLERLYAHL